MRNKNEIDISEISALIYTEKKMRLTSHKRQKAGTRDKTKLNTNPI